MMVLEEEELNIYSVEKLHKLFLELFHKEQNIILDMHQVKKVDMSVIQLLVSLQKSAKESAKTLQLTQVNKEVELIFSKCACEFLLGGSHG